MSESKHERDVKKLFEDNNLKMSSKKDGYVSDSSFNRKKRRHKEQSLNSITHVIQTDYTCIENLDKEVAEVYYAEIRRGARINESSCRKNNKISHLLRYAREILEEKYNIETFCYTEDCKESIRITIQLANSDKTYKLTERQVIELASTRSVRISSSQSSNNKAFILRI